MDRTTAKSFLTPDERYWFRLLYTSGAHYKVISKFFSFNNDTSIYAHSKLFNIKRAEHLYHNSVLLGERK